MKTISFEKLYNTEFYISEPMVKPQYWAARGNVFNALGKPKISHTLLWFKNCAGTVTLPTGEALEVPHNALIYTAKGIEYAIRFQDTNRDREDTVVIHFQMTDKTGEDITPTPRPVVCLKSVDAATALLLDMLAEECKKNVVCIPEVAAGIYKMLAEICQKQKRRTTKNKFARIRRGIELLEGDNDLSIGEIAAECGVSECYFRRLFHQYSGESPMHFRQHHRIERAKQLLLSDEHYTVGEVAAELHFLDIYHFSKTFKKFCGMSPNNFLQSEGEESN
ncbi:MAG: helix-turn-helix transcriptional regulator [Clostridia bacterium]|nr:helix-turn-helix transcriptional regulator [Clostridia bacterium]